MWQVESLLVLKNNRGVEGNRVRHGLRHYRQQAMYTRACFEGRRHYCSVVRCAGLPYDAFFADEDEFERACT